MKNTLLGAAILSAVMVNASTAQDVPAEVTVTVPPQVAEEIVTVTPPVIVEEEPRPTRQANTTEIDCLARNIYFEARGEGLRGMRAVAHVTMNRVRSQLFRRTVCGVVYQPSQFSWTRGPARSPSGSSWAQSQEIARDVYTEVDTNDPTAGATYFHAHSVRPSWARRFTLTATIGGHRFYRA